MPRKVKTTKMRIPRARKTPIKSNGHMMPGMSKMMPGKMPKMKYV